jgi:hypothetical protein
MLKKHPSPPPTPACIVDRDRLFEIVTSIHKATKDSKDAWHRMVKLETAGVVLCIYAGSEAARLRYSIALDDADRRPMFHICAIVDCSVLYRALRTRFSGRARPKVELRTEDNALLIGKPDWSAVEWHFPERLQTGMATPSRLTAAAIRGNAPLAALRFAITSVAHARSADETRSYLCGMQLRCRADGLRVLATDGHRLASAWVPVLWNAGTPDPFELCLTGEAMNLLATLPKGEAEIRVSDQGIEIEGEDLHFVAASRPDNVFACEQVIPQHENKVMLDSNALAALRVACQNAAKEGAALQMRFGEFGFHILHEPEPTIWRGLTNGPLPECHTAIEPRYLLDALEHCHLEATIAYGGELDPILVQGKDSSAFEVIMPRRL